MFESQVLTQKRTWKLEMQLKQSLTDCTYVIIVVVEICLQCFQGQIINPEVIDDRVLINPVESFDQSLY
jgi:hypothetical protein